MKKQLIAAGLAACIATPILGASAVGGPNPRFPEMKTPMQACVAYCVKKERCRRPFPHFGPSSGQPGIDGCNAYCIAICTPLQNIGGGSDGPDCLPPGPCIRLGIGF